jgi:CubicO group peptidase (beta-lactamase class C family)
MNQTSRCVLILISLTLCLSSALAVHGQVSPATTIPSDEEIRALLQARLDPKADTGFVLGLVTPAGERIITVGKAGPNGILALNGDTIFEICSITKTFTAAILSDMVEKGEVALTDPVAKFLPASVRLPERNGKQITLLDLATQSSALPPVPFNMNVGDMSNPYATYTVPLLYEFLSNYQLTLDIGSTYIYSNLGFGLLGHALELKTGLSYEALVRQRILKPLSMNDTAVVLAPAQKARLAIGHNSENGKAVVNWDIPVLTGCGALRSSVSDMLKYLEANMSGSGPLATVFQRCHAAQRPTNMADNDIGLGWMTEKSLSADIVWHNGQTGGFHSFIGFAPKTHTGVIILHNSNANIDAIGFYLMDQIQPHPTKR